MRVDLVGALIVGVSMLGLGDCGKRKDKPTPTPTPILGCHTMNCPAGTTCVEEWDGVACVPAPTPTPEACPFDVPRVAFILCKDHGPWLDGRRKDCTPQSRVAPLGGYPIWPEGDGYRAACERKAAGGEPSLSIEGVGGALGFKRLSNPYQFALRGEGRALLHCYVPAEGDTDLCGYEVSLP